MKKKFCIFIFILLASLFNIQAYETKIHPDVYKSLKNNENVRVIINIKEHSSGKESALNIKKSQLEINLQEKNKEEIISKIPKNKIKHLFDKSIAVEISKKELANLESERDIESVIIDPLVKAFLQDSIPLINATKVWPIQISGINITGIGESVCVIDTGINASHPDFQGRVIAQYCYCSISEGGNSNCCPDLTSEDNNASDNNGHGTHVSGIVGANIGIKGVALNVNIVSIKALNSSGSGITSDIQKAIDWCVANFSVYNISTISMSLGGGAYTSYCNSDPLANSINSAIAKNISVIVATGNDGSSTSISSPACVQNATAVGSTSKTDTISSFSNRNNITELLAPGENINSTYYNGRYSLASGTSMSAPHVAGAFILVRQFFKLQNGRYPTPSEIENTLNNTGKRIIDSNGLNFSRINILQAVISLDNSPPNVTLISPANSSLSSNTTQIFSCNATDGVGLSNITFFLWNLTNSLINQTNIIVSGFFNQSSLNIANLIFGSYKWNCLSTDLNGNSKSAISNFSLTLSNLTVSLSAPQNNFFTNNNQTNFTCTSQSNTAFSLENITFFLWDSSSYLVYNITQNISGTLNSTTFQYAFTNESNYLWNCQTYANNSQNVLATSNNTITFDVSKPIIFVSNPNNSASYNSNSQEIDFTYNITENFNISNCSLIINNLVNLVNQTIVNLSSSQNFIQTFTPGEYFWSVNCTDSALNQANSSQRSFIVNSISVQTTGSSSGGGGGITSSTNTYLITESQSSNGYTQEMNKNDKIKFTFFDEKANQHSLNLDYIGENFVNITIQSKIIKLTLGIGQSIKLNLTSSEYYNLYVKLENIANKKARITIQTINDPIYNPAVKLFEKNNSEINKTKPDTKEENINKLNELIKKLKIYIIILLVVIILILVILKKRTKRPYFLVHMK